MYLQIFSHINWCKNWISSNHLCHLGWLGHMTIFRLGSWSKMYTNNAYMRKNPAISSCELEDVWCFAIGFALKAAVRIPIGTIFSTFFNIYPHLEKRNIIVSKVPGWAGMARTVSKRVRSKLSQNDPHNGRTNILERFHPTWLALSNPHLSPPYQFPLCKETCWPGAWERQCLA